MKECSRKQTNAAPSDWPHWSVLEWIEEKKFDSPHIRLDFLFFLLRFEPDELTFELGLGGLGLEFDEDEDVEVDDVCATFGVNGLFASFTCWDGLDAIVSRVAVGDEARFEVASIGMPDRRRW